MNGSKKYKKKLLLIYPVAVQRARSSVDSKFSQFPPLSLGIIARLTPDHWEVEIFDETFEEFSYREADLVGLTGCTTQANRAYQIAQIYRSKGVPTVMGGIHASMLPEEALGFVDTVVVGEAESVWEEVISDLESNNLQEIYRGEFLSLDGAPTPRRELFDSRYKFTSIQTSRGCPMECDFCSVSALNGRRYRKRPVEEVLDELQSIPHDKFIFVDDNLFGRGKEDNERAISLFKGMIERGINKQWVCQTTVDASDNEEMLYYASKSGCRVVFLGIESERESSLKNLGKNVNMGKLDRYNEVFKLVNRYNIIVHAAFMFGMDADSIDDLHCRVRFINNSRIDVIHPTVLTPYPGTKIYHKFKESGRLLYTNYPEDWDKYDFSEVLYQPAQMTEKELRETMAQCWAKIFNWRKIISRTIKTFIFTRMLRLSLYTIIANLVYRSIAQSKIKDWKITPKSK